jgi:DNA polymerase-1
MEDRTIAIIDADSVVWNTAYACDKQGGDFRDHLGPWLQELFNRVGATHYIGVLQSPEIQRRKALFPTYKSKRPPKPTWYESYGPEIETYLREVIGFISSPAGYESDDAVASYARLCRESKIKYVVCGIDKDLKMIEGRHYNYREEREFLISPIQADYHLFTQVLTGDDTDTIGGCPGIGPVKAAKALENCKSLLDLPTYTLNPYIGKLGLREGLARFAETYLLVRLNDTLPVDLSVAKEVIYNV